MRERKNSCNPMRWNPSVMVPQNSHVPNPPPACPIHIRLSSLVRELFVYRSQMPASADDVYAWHAKPDALTRLTPPWENARVIERTGSIEQLGSRVKIR